MKTEILFGAMVAELRKQRGWTQEHLAAVSGLDPRTIQRVERDVTKGSEALMAIASAFGIELKDLGRRYWIAESKPPRALEIRRPEDLAETIKRAHHYYSYRTLCDLRPEIEAAAEPLIEEIFADIWAMTPDEPELVRSWYRSAREPLGELRGLGLTIFSIQEQRDIFLRDRDHKPLPFENCSTGYYIVVPMHAAFHLGDRGSLATVHRFNDDCQEAIEAILRVIKKPEMIGIGATAVHLAYAAGGEDKLNWCDHCFPVTEGDTRIGWSYLEKVLGMSKEEMLLAAHEGEELPIVGLA